MANKKIQLQSSGGTDNLFPRTYCFPDWSDLILSTSSTSYTATQNCFCTIIGYTMSAQILINGTSVFHSNSLATYAACLCGPFYLEAGDTIAFSGTQNGIGLNAYGVKY